MWNTWCWVIAALGLAACSDNLLRPPPVVVRTEPAGAAECPFGGSVVSSGLDEDHDEALDDGEIATRNTVCNDPPGPPPPMIVVRLTAEPAGAHCDLAGTAVQSGPDRNANGRLDDDEVEHIDYACGERLLTRLAAEPPGPHCFTDGVALLLGRDRNHDSQLGDDEIEHTEYECGDVVSRDIVVQTAADAAALANIATIAGSLVVDATALTELAFPRLVQVRGSLEVTRNAALAHIAMPVLQAVDGRFALERDPQLASIDVPQLHRTGSLSIQGDPALHDLRWLPALTTVAADVQISNNDALASTDLPVGRIGGDLVIDGNAQLTHTSWALAGRTGAIRITSNPQLERVDLAGTPSDRLTAVHDVTISSNYHLGHISIDADYPDAIGIYNNPLLAEVAVSAFQVTDDVVLRGNGPLTVTFSARSQIDFRIGGALTLSGPVEALASPFPLIVTGDCTIDLTRLSSFVGDHVC